MSDNKLYHHGVKGQKWGIRRYQNKNGSLTALGEKRMARLNARKTADDLKAKRKERKLAEEKAKQDMKQDALDRESARAIANRTANANIKNASQRAKAETQAIKTKAKNEDLYDLPDDPSANSQKQAEFGKQLLLGALAVVGTVAAVVAIKKFTQSKSAPATKQAVKNAVQNPQSNINYKNTAKHLKKLRAKNLKAAKKADLLKTGQRELRKQQIAKRIAKNNKYYGNAKSHLKQLRYTKKLTTAAANIVGGGNP